MSEHINPNEIQAMKDRIGQQDEQITNLAETVKSMAETQVQLAKSNQATVEALKNMAAQAGMEVDQ